MPTPREERALAILALLEERPRGTAELIVETGWTKSQVASAIETARTEVCPMLGVTIPHPVPDDGFRYRVTGMWSHADGTPAIAAGTSYAVGVLEARIRTTVRDVRVALGNLDPRSIEGRKANFMNKHLSHILRVLAEIDGRATDGEG